MKKLFPLILSLFIVSFSYSQIEDFTKIKKEKEPVPYDSSFISFGYGSISKEIKKGLIGESITFLDVSSSNLKSVDGKSISYSDIDKFKLNSFLIVDFIDEGHNGSYKIYGDNGKYIYEISILDKWIINSYIDKLKMDLIGKKIIPLKLSIEFTGVDDIVTKLDGNKSYEIQSVKFGKLPSLQYGIVIQLTNDILGVYGTDSYSQPNEKGWINLTSSNLYKSEVLFCEESVFNKFKKDNLEYLSEMREGKVKLGMNEKQCRYSWGMPSRAFKNIAGFDKVLQYGDTGNSQDLYFKKDKLELIK